jgi:hypothetical protein
MSKRTEKKILVKANRATAEAVRFFGIGAKIGNTGAENFRGG